MLLLNALTLARTMFSINHIVFEADDIKFATLWWFIYAGISCLLVLFAGIMSGLTLGLMSLGLVELEILQRSGSFTEKKQAATILPVVQKQHQLLVTLLLCNACAMEALPIYLDKIFHPFVAVVLSVTFVLAFGEIIPQAICSRYGLYVGANLVWLVRILMFICYPIAYPIGKVLDAALGHDDALFRRAQLKALVSIHGQEAGKGGELTHDETTIISGALDLTEKTAEEAMTPIESTFSLDVNSKLDWEAIGKILARGHSRVPVYSGCPKNIIGLLLVKSLLTVRAETETPVSAVSIRRIPRVPSNMPLYDILNEFQKGSSHMAAVVKVHAKSKNAQPTSDGEKFNEIKFANGDSQLNAPLLTKHDGKSEHLLIDVEKAARPMTIKQQKTHDIPRLSEDVEDGEVIGIITLEDVFEELLQEEIVDETDVYVDVHKRIRVVAAAAASYVARAPSNRRLPGPKPAGAQGKQSQTTKKSGGVKICREVGCYLYIKLASVQAVVDTEIRPELYPAQLSSCVGPPQLIYTISPRNQSHTDSLRSNDKILLLLNMGFKTVYRSLGELFPQVDSRILKAVAIEHPKDADVAADVVISEVLPFLATIVDSPPVNSDRKPSGLSAGRAEHEEHINTLRSDQVDLGKTVGDSLESNSIDKACTCKTDLGSSGHPSGSTHQEKSENSTAPVSVDLNADTNQLEGCIESEELILLVRPQHQDNVQSVTSQTSELVSSALPCEEITDSIQVCGTMETKVPASLGKCQDDNITVGGKQYFQVISTSLTQENGDFTGDQGEWKGSDGPLPDDFDTSGKISQVVSCVDGGKSPRVEPCVDGTDLEVDNSLVERTPNAAEVDFQSELSGTPTNSCKNLKFNQDIKIDFLEDIVEAARHNKRTLFLSMESIMNMMRKVELQEKAAEDAKEEASSAGLDILTKANELKQMLEHAKDANDMHAGEVYGERAILATEVRELQARLLSLSDERDKALAIIDEMHQSLEERLAAAEELKKAAEKQKLEQEEAARNALAEQEAIMGQVVQESKIIQQEADENSKLREFLMDRGRVVDTLQGEISVICQDVRLLKERFDERIPLSKSISSSQTSCILASSGSSIRSIATDLVPEPRETSKSLKDRSLTPSSIDGRSPTSPTTSSFIDGRSPKSGLKEERTNGEVASDDDWEIFE